MSAQNPYSKYRDNKIFQASKEELTLMLYDGALKFCNQAIAAIEQKDIIKANDLIIRVENIVREFQLTLDRSYDVSKYFDSMYEYMYRRLIDANMKKDKDILMEVRDYLREFRDTWAEAMKKSKIEASAAGASR